MVCRRLKHKSTDTKLDWWNGKLSRDERDNLWSSEGSAWLAAFTAPLFDGEKKRKTTTAI